MRFGNRSRHFGCRFLLSFSGKNGRIFFCLPLAVILSKNPPFFSFACDSIKKIHSFFGGAKFLTRKNGSLEEAFPNEGSYCVTALVAFDFLVTIDLLSDRITDSKRDEFIEIIRPFINFLIKSDESHAIISNHLATAVAALVRWDNLILILTL